MARQFPRLNAILYRLSKAVRGFIIMPLICIENGAQNRPYTYAARQLPIC